ncbi:MAG: NADP-dependent oxidoreductase [Armatimonadetes bacterium]|nr:NADP-dependent oxidoreductase [Armatimonadota bacterium]
MRAVRIHEYGGPEVLRYEKVPRPRRNRGELLVRVRACGVNPVDWKVRAGMTRSWLALELPLTLGWDLAGTVEDVGCDANGFAEGDEVFAYTGVRNPGVYSEYAALDADIAARKPTSLDHAHAAAVPLAGLTAWQALFDHAGLQEGQTVLIHAAAGGVGHFAVQLARWKGARVIGTGSAHNEGFVRAIGADQFVDYPNQRFEDVARDVDAVFDTVGGETRERSWGVLKRGGFLVSICGRPTDEEAAAHGVRAKGFLVKPDARELYDLAALIDDGYVRVEVSSAYPLAEAGRAHAESETGHVRGKIALMV